MAKSSITVLAGSAVAVPHTGDTNETTLATITIPAGAMGKNGQLRITTNWSYTNSGNNKTLRIDFGGTDYRAFVVTTTDAFRDQITIANRNATNSQVGGLVGTAVAYTSTTIANVTSAVDTTAAVTLTITGQLASGGETVTLESYLVELIRLAT